MMTPVQKRNGCVGLLALPDGVGRWGALRTLSLNRCSNLTSLPELGSCRSLQMLVLTDCTGLTSLCLATIEIGIKRVGRRC